MHIARRRGWEIAGSAVTAESVMLNRRRVLSAAAWAALLPAGRAVAADPANTAASPPAWAAKPALRNPAFDGGRAITDPREATTYNNYYEFSEDKDLWEAAQAFATRPRSITIDGLIEAPRTLDTDALIAEMQLEERIYRHRCVERWAMTVPWTGFPLAALVKAAGPKSEARYIRFETVADRKTMPGLRRSLYPWPYVEALTIEEAMNDLAFLSVGLYGKPLPPQNGGPIRLTVPWKYGFKSGKALTRISFVAKRPTTFWQDINPDEYGFWANVNPAVAHPRWSQANEMLIGTDDIRPTVIYNGYGPQVASLYTGLQAEKLFM